MTKEQHQAGQAEFPFGKYKGDTICSVLHEDPQYLRWSIDNVKNMSDEFKSNMKLYLSDSENLRKLKR